MAEDGPQLPLADDSRFPMIRVTWPSVTTDEFLDRYMAFVVGRLVERVRFAIVLDGRVATGASRLQQLRIGELLETHRHLTAPFLVMALVIGNPLGRATLQAINALHPPPFPQRVFSNTDEGLRWAELELSAPRANRR